MTLTLGTGPFGPRSPGRFNFERPPGNVLYLEELPRRVRGILAGETVVDSASGHLLHETGHLPMLYVPEEDLRAELLEPTDHSTHCPFKGDASYRSIRVGERLAENAVWHYPEPLEGAPDLRGLASIYWKALDEWWVEEERVLGHMRDPYHRVDVFESSRHVRVTVGGEILAESDRPKLLFETGLPVRYYLPPEDVQTGLLIPTETHTDCPYKGRASYWAVETGGGERFEDVAWGYPEPLREAAPARDHICFLGDGVDIHDSLAREAA